MDGLVGLAVVLGRNYTNHKHGRPTMCSTTRKYLPPWAFVLGWTGLTYWLVKHVLEGYERDRR